MSGSLVLTSLVRLHRSNQAKMKTVFVFLALTTVAFSQSDRARITGRIVDPSGASVPNASITVTNLTTEASVRSRVSDGIIEWTAVSAATKQHPRPFADVAVPSWFYRSARSEPSICTFNPRARDGDVTAEGMSAVETSSASIGSGRSARSVTCRSMGGCCRNCTLVPGALTGQRQLNESASAGRE
jgi:hypothetical protein